MIFGFIFSTTDVTSCHQIFDYIASIILDCQAFGCKLPRKDSDFLEARLLSLLISKIFFRRLSEHLTQFPLGLI
jgi:hypothetical protein